MTTDKDNKSRLRSKVYCHHKALGRKTMCHRQKSLSGTETRAVNVFVHRQTNPGRRMAGAQTQ